MRCPRSTSGFTLYELILAIALTSVITTWAAVTYSKTVDTWSGIKGTADLNSEADHAYEALGRDFSNVLSPRLSGVPLTAAPDKAAGDSAPVADSLVVPVQALVPDPSSAKERLTGIAVSYHLDPATHALVRSTGVLTAAKPAGYPKSVAKNISSMRIEYSGQPDGQAWTTSWTGTGLPKAVRVSLALADPNHPEQTLSRKAVFAIHVQ